MGGGRGPAAEQRMDELRTKQARGKTEPVPFETGKPTGAMLLVLADKEELMDNKQNGEKVYEIIKAKKNVPVAKHTLKGITHYGIYREGFEEATKLELEWFGKHLKMPSPKQEK